MSAIPLLSGHSLSFIRIRRNETQLWVRSVRNWLPYGKNAFKISGMQLIGRGQIRKKSIIFGNVADSSKWNVQIQGLGYAEVNSTLGIRVLTLSLHRSIQKL